jgi:two-component system chemotaxis response regulator CheB
VIRVLLVDDSSVMREYIAYLLQQDPALLVAGQARDGVEAVELARRLRPDVILMDVHMPRLDGYEATRRIMAEVPTPIVMMSTSFDPRGLMTSPQELVSFSALRAGALTLVEKPLGPDDPRYEESLKTFLDTTKLMSEVKVVRRSVPRPPPLRSPPRGRIAIVAIAASTGGPQTLAKILEGLPRQLPVPILLVQHIAAGFTAGFVEWLAGVTDAVQVRLAGAGEQARPGVVYVAPERRQLGVTSGGVLRLSDDPAEDGFRPSADHLFESVAAAYGASSIGVVLTGMGRDGALGLRKLRDAGALTIAQDEASSVVFGMPQEAIRHAAAEHVLAPDQIAEAIARFTRTRDA